MKLREIKLNFEFSCKFFQISYYWPAAQEPISIESRRQSNQVHEGIMRGQCVCVTCPYFICHGSFGLYPRRTSGAILELGPLDKDVHDNNAC